MLPKLVALSGKSGSGKDTVGQYLRGIGYSQFALAWPMKNEACGAYENPNTGEGGIATYEEVHHDKPDDIRAWLQYRGTEMGWMKYGKGYWLRIADAWMRTLRENCSLGAFYITDVRFPHEVKWVEDQGGVVIRLVGRGGLEGEAGQHPSETALDDYPFEHVVDNSGSISATVHDVFDIIGASITTC